MIVQHNNRGKKAVTGKVKEDISAANKMKINNSIYVTISDKNTIIGTNIGSKFEHKERGGPHVNNIWEWNWKRLS